MQAHLPIRGLIWQCTLLLRTASLLVPAAQRAEWYKEWHAEVWHWLHFLSESGRLNQQTTLDLLRHCWGAFPDAAWHRFNQKKVLRAWYEVPRSARFCLGMCLSLLLVVVLLTGLAPTIRSSFRPLPFRQADRLACLSLHGSFSQLSEYSLFHDAANWSQWARSTEMVAAYSWRPVALILPDDVVRDISARVSPNFFQLLGNGAALGRVFAPGDETSCAGCVVITHRLWQSQFHSDREIIGKTISLDGRPATVLGVLPENFVFIFPEVSIWMLPGEGASATNPAHRAGAVLRMGQHVSLPQTAEEFRRFARNAGYPEPQMDTFVSRARQGTRLYLFFCALSLLGAIALGSSRLGGAKTRKLTLSLHDSFHWWGFFLLKTVLLLALCFVASLEFPSRVSIILSGSVHPLAGPFSTWLFLVMAMIALSWSLYDQGRRCRLCLKRLGHAASVGTPSYLLLEWWGTELVCSDGHGLLHVPEMRSSWQEFDQWVSLDESWKPLFENEEPVHTP